jgi:hypothetical protein
LNHSLEDNVVREVVTGFESSHDENSGCYLSIDVEEKKKENQNKGEKLWRG